MPLIKFSHLTEKGNVRSRIFYNKDLNYTVKDPSAFGPWVKVEQFKYIHKHPYISPHLFTNHKGVTCILPGNIDVIPGTTYDDIEWIREEDTTSKPLPRVWSFDSSSNSEIKYYVGEWMGKLSCDCPGVWRAKSGICKHIKEVKQLIK